MAGGIRKRIEHQARRLAFDDDEAFARVCLLEVKKGVFDGAFESSGVFVAPVGFDCLGEGVF